MLTIDALDAIEKSENDLLEYETILLRNLETNLPITRAPKVRRPKTMGFWTDIFPYLNDDNPYNNFKNHFRIMRTTFNRLLRSISTHPISIFTTKTTNAD